MMKRKVEIKNEQMFFAAAVAILFIVLAIRAFFSIPLDDELCYLASLKRYLQGDRFLLDDWHPPTQLNTWPIFQLVRWIPGFRINILQARLVYLCVHFASGIVIWRLLRERKGIRWMVFVYLCFTPYNITALSYNTMSIASFFVLTAFCLSRKQWRRRDYLFSGFLLCLSMFSNPYLFLVYLVYLAVCVIGKCRKKAQDGLFSCGGIIWITCGALLLGGLFLISLIGKGSVQDYMYNIKMIFSDAEHKANPFVKLVQSQWQVFRVYWRCSVVLVCVYAAAIFKRKTLNTKQKRGLFLVAVVFTVYAVLRFAFIYGSIANNLTMVPPFFLGAAVFLLTVCGKPEDDCERNEDARKTENDCDRGGSVCGAENSAGAMRRIKAYFAALAFGYLFAVCNFLGTNTEILSMSAMFVIPSGITILMLCEYGSLTAGEKKPDMQRILAYSPIVVFAFCVLWLRLFFTWFDAPLSELDTKITQGPCRGIYTTRESAEEYQEFLSAVDLCRITSQDKVLFLPISSLPLMYSDGEIAVPYVTRFAVDSAELMEYYETHPDKIPTKIVITDCEDGRYSGEEEKTAEYFLARGYQTRVVTDQVVMLYRQADRTEKGKEERKYGL
ncbi:MAG: glucosyltransferase domain-containing protein [Clostridium sp.]|nr:glucosyltransferase domain-containing protein [Clostridium sp.]